MTSAEGLLSVCLSPVVCVSLTFPSPLVVLQGSAGPQCPRGQSFGFLRSLLCSGVPVSWTHLGPEHLLTGGGGCLWTGQTQISGQVDLQRDGPSHRIKFPGHGVTLRP